MKALSSFNKSIPKILKSLSKAYGVNVSVYFPTKLDSNLGGKGSNVEYSSEAEIEDKMLIPSLLREKMSGSQGVLDPFSDDSNILFLPGSTYIPDYSKVVVSMSRGEAVLVFRVDSCSTIKDDEYVYLRKYSLMPISDISHMANEVVTMEEMLEKEDSLTEDLDTPVLRDSLPASASMTVSKPDNDPVVVNPTTVIQQSPTPVKISWDYAPLIEDE